MTSFDISSLAGRTVRVKSTAPRPDFPETFQGTIRLRSSEESTRPQVELWLESAETLPSQSRIVLDEHALTRLLKSERNGSFEFAIPASLD
jgi:hypothetical protein